MTGPPIEVPVTLTACPACGGQLEEVGVELASVTELSEAVQPRVRQFRVAVCRCTGCGKRVRGQHPELAREIERVLERLAAGALDDEPLVPCHGGFRHRQLLGDDRQLTLLDWDALTLAHPALDAATFLRGLRREAIVQPDRFSELERLAGVFRQAFLSCDPAVDRCHLALYEALLLTQGVLREFRRPKRGAEVVRRLLAAAERLIDEGTQSLVDTRPFLTRPATE
ncbi:MAG: phosphotransferase [Planctomycetes bacterium]|nr:phosphotransferase [Planctomycetota bacterium]